MRLRATASGVCVAVACLTGCGSSHSAAAPAALMTTESPTMLGGVQVLQVVGNSHLMFEQTRLTAKAGIPVRIEFSVVGGVPHNFTLTDGPGGHTPTISSGTADLTVTFPTPGVYHYRCTIHPGTMEGTITVS